MLHFVEKQKGLAKHYFLFVRNIKKIPSVKKDFFFKKSHTISQELFWSTFERISKILLSTGFESTFSCFPEPVTNARPNGDVESIRKTKNKNGYGIVKKPSVKLFDLFNKIS